MDGLVAPGFEGVRTALAGVVGPGDGAAVAALVGGRPVVDLWAGTVPERGLVHTFSAVKPLAATCVLLLAERGRLALDDPVGRWWPELRAGADGLLVAHLLAHQAGLVTVPATVPDLLDGAATAAALAAAPPDWPPGQAHGEHALTYGNLLGELVRRVDGRSLGRFLAEELAGPLHLDLHVGVPGDDLARVVDVVGVTEAWWRGVRGEPGSLRWAALGAGVDGALVNGEAWRTGEVPAVNGHATARALAAFYAAVLDGRVPAAVARPATSGPDLVLGTDVTWTLGSMQFDAVELGMGGVGGAYAGARPAIGLAWAFLPTRMAGIDRAEAVERALLEAIAG